MIEVHVGDDQVLDLLGAEAMVFQRREQARDGGVGVVVDKRGAITIDEQIGRGKALAAEVARVDDVDAGHYDRPFSGVGADRQLASEPVTRPPQSPFKSLPPVVLGRSTLPDGAEKV